MARLASRDGHVTNILAAALSRVAAAVLRTKNVLEHALCVYTTLPNAKPYSGTYSPTRQKSLHVLLLPS